MVARVFLGMLLSAAAGCLPPPVCGLVEVPLCRDGVARTYQRFVPASCTEGKPVPLVVVLHGLTEDGRAMARETDFNAIAEREGFVVAYPDGLLRSFNVFAEGWPDDVGFVLAVVDDVCATCAVDPGRIYLTGASNGGFLTYRLVCEAPGVFAAAAPVMATMPQTVAEACEPPPTPILLIHGTEDPIVPYDDPVLYAGPRLTVRMLPIPDTAEFWVAASGCDPEPSVDSLPDTDPADGTTAVCETWTGDDPEAEVVLYTVEGGGHTWPGGYEAYPAWLVGRQCNDFDASEVIWCFFARHAAASSVP